MKMISRLLYLLGFCFFPAMLIAQSSTDLSQSEVINRIFEEIPVEAQLEETSQKLHSLLSQNPFDLQPSNNEQMLDLYAEYFLSDSLVNHTKETFSNNYEPEPAAEVLEWFQTKDIQPVLTAEKEFYMLQGIRKRVISKYELEQNPPDEQRIELINQLAKAMSAVETEMESRVIIFRALVSAFGELSEQKTLAPPQMEGIVDNYRYQVQSQVDRETTNRLLTLYHGLDSEKLQKQIDFYETDSGQWLTNTISKSMHSTYQSAADHFLDAVKKL